MIVTLDEVKQYLRVDYEEDDQVLVDLTTSAESLCMDILRTDDILVLSQSDKAKAAVMYTVAYLVEHREEANHYELTMTLRALLGGDRKAEF